MIEKIKDISEKDTSGTASVKLLFDEINNSSAKEICEWILDSNFSNIPPTILNLIINSPGGDLNSAFAIIDIMYSSKIPIRTIGLGQIQSAGLMIFLAGTKGERLLTPNTSIMSHAYSGGNFGKFHELVAIQKEYTLTFDRMVSHYKKCTGLNKNNVCKYLLPTEDVYLTAEEALKFGICDKVTIFN